MPTPAFEFNRRFEPMRARAAELERRLGDPKVTSDIPLLRSLTREYRAAAAALGQLQEYERLEKEAREADEMAHATDDAEMHELAQKELADLNQRLEELSTVLEAVLRPRSPEWDKGCIVEIRAAAGGEESALFAGALFRMYSRYAETHGLKIEVTDSRPSELKGFKEVVFAVEGDEPYRRFRFESGVHRVQRVPETEASGRIHTSTVTVAVLPEPEEVDIKINPDELRVDVYRAGGHGGQGVNKTESAVRITHVPTGLVAQCQDERSQQRNKANAMKVLAARLFEARSLQGQSKTTATRRKQIGSGDRSEKIRTYNFPQNRLTDHRIGLSVHNLDSVIEGDLDSLFTALEKAEAEVE
ncbi:MAG: peptide chain release factor 1 [candidate division WOR-3 bacterium]|nr:peptide chain release factor 1 [candidate division WOR-3 bacterium]